MTPHFNLEVAGRAERAWNPKAGLPTSHERAVLGRWATEAGNQQSGQDVQEGLQAMHACSGSRADLGQDSLLVRELVSAWLL